MAARVPAHATSLMIIGFVSTYASTEVDAAAFPSASYEATVIVVDALDERERATPVSVVVAKVNPFIVYA